MELQSTFEIFGLKVPHSAIFAAISSLVVFSLGFVLNIYWKKIADNAAINGYEDYLKKHLILVEKRIKDQIKHLQAFKDNFNVPNSKFHIEPLNEYDFKGHSKELHDLIYRRKLLKRESRTLLYYNLDLFLRAYEKTWTRLSEMYDLLFERREADYQKFSSAELNFKLGLFELDHNHSKTPGLLAFFKYQSSLSKAGTYNDKFVNYYSKVKDYCFDHGDILYGDLLKRYFEIEYAHFYLKSFDDQYLNMINNRLSELGAINEQLTSAKLDLINSKSKWIFIP